MKIKLKSFATWLEDMSASNAAIMDGPKAGNQPTSYMGVSMGKKDVSLKTNYEQGFKNMLQVVSRLLADKTQGITPMDHDQEGLDKDQQDVGWADLYQLDAVRSVPQNKRITLVYRPYWGKGTLGKAAWTAGWFLKNPLTRPAKWVGQQAGLLTHPESSYLNQFKSDLLSYASQNVIEGLDDWDVTTSAIGRDIVLTPKV